MSLGLGHYPSLLVTGTGRIKNGDGYLLGYTFGSTGTASAVEFRSATATGTEIWGDQVPATTGEAARYTFPVPGLHFSTALYVTGTSFPAKLYLIFM